MVDDGSEIQRQIKKAAERLSDAVKGHIDAMEDLCRVARKSRPVVDGPDPEEGLTGTFKRLR